MLDGFRATAALLIKRRAFAEDGFLVVPNALDGETVERLLGEADRLAALFLDKPEIAGKPEYNHLDLRRGLLKEKALLALVANSATVPLVVQLLESEHSPALDDGHLQTTRSARRAVVSPRLASRHPHARDLGHERLPLAGIKVCYCLTDFHKPNCGMTLMARGTHLHTEPLKIPKGAVDPVGVEVCDLQLNAGDALFFENRIFHTAAPNRSDRTSKVVIYGYAYRWMRPEVYLETPDEQQLLQRRSDHAAIARRLSRRRYAAVGVGALGQEARRRARNSSLDHRRLKANDVTARRSTTQRRRRRSLRDSRTFSWNLVSTRLHAVSLLRRTARPSGLERPKDSRLRRQHRHVSRERRRQRGP